MPEPDRRASHALPRGGGTQSSGLIAMSLNRTSIGGPAWTWKAMIPDLANMGSIAVDDAGAVEVDGHVIPLGRDHEIVPVALAGQRLTLLLGVLFEDVPAALLVEQSPVAVGDVGLRAGTAPSGARLLRNWMPELWLTSLSLAFRTKSPYGLSVTRNSFFLSVSVGPADDLAVLDGEHRLVVGRDPAGRSLPLKSGVKPESSSARAVQAEQQGGEPGREAGHGGSPWWWSVAARPPGRFWPAARLCRSIGRSPVGASSRLAGRARPV